MSIYVGIDTIIVRRMWHWKTLSHTKLRRIFTDEELQVCFATPELTPYRLATRFAAKEATYKALSQYTTPPPFLTLCQHASILATSPPVLKLAPYPNISSSVSMTHTHDTATAIVTLSTCQCT